MSANLLVALLLAVATVPPHAEDKVASTPRQRAETFLTRLEKGEVAPAYDDLFMGSPVVKAKPTEVEGMKRQTESTLPLYGTAMGFELLDQKVYGESLVRLTYLQKRSIHPLVWRFWFYRPAQDWYLDIVQWNDQFQYLQGD